MTANITWSTIDKSPSAILSNGNLTVVGQQAVGARATEGKTSGKWYWEVKISAGGTHGYIGVSTINFSLTTHVPESNENRGYYGFNGAKYPSANNYGSPFAVGDVISVLLDLVEGNLEFWKNGVSQGVAFSNLSIMNKPLFPFVSGGSTVSNNYTANFGATAFSYQIPQGYKSYNWKPTNKYLISSGDNYYSFKGFGVNMTNYFTFDEPSGNITDSKGTAVGTISGGVTRVTGWNGKGSALSFNGTNGYVEFNQKVIPIGKKSIRFRIRKNGIPVNQYETLVANVSGGAGQYGIQFAVTNFEGGSLYVASTKNGWSGLFANVTTPKDLNIFDNQWHDILFTWDGQVGINNVKLYVDNMGTPVATSDGIATEVNAPSINLTLGCSFNGSDFRGNYFNGQIDNLEIYNDIIEPYDKLINLSSFNTTDNFIEYGLDNNDFLDLESQINKIQYCVDQRESLGNGKIFKKKIDTAKTSIKSVSIT